MKFLQMALIASLALAASACDSDNDDDVMNPEPLATADLQVLHASADAPAVNVLLDGDEVLSGLNYQDGSERLSIDEGIHSVQVDALLPDGPATVIGPLDLEFAADTIYSIVAVGKAGDGTLEPLVVEQPRVDVSPGSARALVLHAAPDAPAVDVYVTTPGANLSASAPVGSFAYTETLGPTELAAGDYQVRVTPAGEPSNVIYDSGTISFGDGDDLLLAAAPNTATGESPVSIIALNGSDSFRLLDASAPARLRVVHASADAPPVDVIANDSVTLVSALSFPLATGFLDVEPAAYNVKVTASGNPGAIVIDEDLSLEAGVTYDVLAIGPLAAIEPLVATDDFRRVATEAKVRVMHASPTAQDVDVYITAPGEAIDDATPVLPGLAFGDNTGFLSLDAGDYDVTITPAGSKAPALGPLTISVAPGGLYTAIARDPAGGGAPPELTLLDDFAP